MAGRINLSLIFPDDLNHDILGFSSDACSLVTWNGIRS